MSTEKELEALKAQIKELEDKVSDLSYRLLDAEAQPGLAATLRWLRSRVEDLHDRYESWRKVSLQQWRNKIIDWGLKILK